MITLIKRLALIALVVVLVASVAEAKTFSYIDNGTIKIGVITDWGAAIGYFSRVSPEQNLVNSMDKGREIQQSYYGDANGHYWSGMPWYWNPVQSGDQAGFAGEVVSFVNDGTSIYAKTIPKDWSLSNVPIEGYMEEWITLSGDTAKIRFKFTYTGSHSHGTRTQELPAAFFVATLSKYVSYLSEIYNYSTSQWDSTGYNSPWTNDTLYETTSIPGPFDTPGNIYARSPERWSAFVNGSNWGVGIYTPHQDIRIAYRNNTGSCTDPGCGDQASCEDCGPEGCCEAWIPANQGPDGINTSYVATIADHAFTPSTATYEYTVYLTIGAVTDIRTRFFNIYSNPEYPGFFNAVADLEAGVCWGYPQEEIDAVSTLSSGLFYGMIAENRKIDSIANVNSDWCYAAPEKLGIVVAPQAGVTVAAAPLTGNIGAVANMDGAATEHGIKAGELGAVANMGHTAGVKYAQTGTIGSILTMESTSNPIYTSPASLGILASVLSDWNITYSRPIWRLGVVASLESPIILGVVDRQELAGSIPAVVRLAPTVTGAGAHTGRMGSVVALAATITISTPSGVSPINFEDGIDRGFDRGVERGIL